MLVSRLCTFLVVGNGGGTGSSSDGNDGGGDGA
jgi:hypothetical protein